MVATDIYFFNLGYIKSNTSFIGAIDLPGGNGLGFRFDGLLAQRITAAPTMKIASMIRAVNIIITGYANDAQIFRIASSFVPSPVSRRAVWVL